MIGASTEGRHMDTSDARQTDSLEKQRRFVRAMSKSIEGRPLTQSERSLLDALLEALMRGDDVSDLIGVKRPHTRRASDNAFVALHYLCLTQLMHTPSEEAWRVVGDTWQLKVRDVRWLVVKNRMPAQAALHRHASEPERLLRICERHARGARPGRNLSDPNEPTQAAGDALIAMLARLWREPSTAVNTISTRLAGSL